MILMLHKFLAEECRTDLEYHFWKASENPERAYPNLFI